MRKSLYPQLALLLELMDITAPGAEISWDVFFCDELAERSAGSEGSHGFGVFLTELFLSFPRFVVLQVVEVLPVFVLITFSLAVLGVVGVGGVLVRAKLSNCLTLSFTLVGWGSLANSLQWFTIIDLLGFTGGGSVGTDPNTDLTTWSRVVWLSLVSQSSRISGKLFPKL